MRLLLLSLCVTLALSQVYYRPVAQTQTQRVIVQQPTQQRVNYYPVRTNCQNKCNQQTRYRWNYRPVVPAVNVIRPTQTKTILTKPFIQIQTAKPNVPVATTTNLPTPPPEKPTYPSTLSSSSTAAPTTTTTTTTTTTPAPTTEAPTTTTTAPSTTTELPTPEPESTTPEMLQTEATTPSTTRYMRPERKQTTKSKFFNPCPTGRALLNEFETPISCNYLNQPNGGCPEDYWCHTGASFATTACCPKAEKVDRCEQRRDVGEGSELVARWYFDKQSRICKRFLYKGIRGNQNNFVTKVQCQDACESAATVDIQNPCRFNKPAIHSNGSRVICGPNDDSMCPSNFYCHIGENPEMTACCESSGISDPCLLALNVGQGKGILKRFYYNTFSKRCTEFIYKGLRGNENNFLTIKDCQDTCQKWSSPCPSSLNIIPKKECTSEGNECSSDQWCHFGNSTDNTVCCPLVSADPCSQPLIYGEGSSNISRWYSDPNEKGCAKPCKQFAYKGTRGNQNNFLTKEACEQQCKRECKSPCGSGSSMLLTSTDEPRLCSPTSPCPNTHWCHVGITPESTVCCSAVANTCELPMEKGDGNSHLTRWHFDSKQKKCVKFIYSGEGGNQNMFLTIDDCMAVCPVYENPCSSGKPLLVGSQPKICNPSERCPSTHFCHIGVDDKANYCCPKNGDPCEQDLTSGAGGLALTRFYFDKETKRCREFAYQGTKGNANNFLSLEDCEAMCPVTPNPCKLGEPLLSLTKEPVICGGEDTCAGGYWCHVGATPETTNCCPGTRRPCDLSLETGEGSYSLERWFYDGGIQMCRPFVYKGMKGNANNFLTKQACRQACKELNPCGYGNPLADRNGDFVQCTGQNTNSCPTNFYCHIGGSALNTVCCPKRGVDPCDQPLIEATGSDDLPRWFFDVKKNKCSPFTYGGIGGNENNFISQKTCEAACPVYRSYCPHGIPLIENEQVISCGIDHGCPDGFICHMSSEYNVSICCQDPMDFCLSPRDPGPCNGTETRYGYNAQTDTCIEYKYGGCEGTLNNFNSLQRCTEICCKEYKRKH